MRIVLNCLLVFGLFFAVNVFASTAAVDSGSMVKRRINLIDDKNNTNKGNAIDSIDMGQVEGLLQDARKAQSENVSTEEDGDSSVFDLKSLDYRLTSIEERIDALSNQVSILNNRVVSLEKGLGRIDRLEKKISSSFYGEIQAYIDQMKYFLGPELFLITVIIIIASLLLLLIYLLIPRRPLISNTCCQDDFKDDEDDEGDEEDEEDEAGDGLNFDMAEEEGEDDDEDLVTESKLNLARAYIEMGEPEKAKPMLVKILSYGNDEEQEEAKDLLDKIKYSD